MPMSFEKNWGILAPEIEFYGFREITTLWGKGRGGSGGRRRA
jgi:hypothetical protein